jgi:hypothetical protein
MAIINEWTKEQERAWAAWLAERPPAVRAVAERLPPNRLYLLKTSKHRVMVLSFQEPKNGGPITITVAVIGKYNFMFFDRQVFGVNPDDLEECDLPEPGVPLGTIFTEPEEVEAWIDFTRPYILKRKRGE